MADRGMRRRGISGISVSSAVRTAASQVETGDAGAAQAGPSAGAGEAAPYVDFLVEIVEAVPDITLDELAAALESEPGARASGVDLAGAHRAGLTYKKSRSLPRNGERATSARRAPTG